MLRHLVNLIKLFPVKNWPPSSSRYTSSPAPPSPMFDLQITGLLEAHTSSLSHSSGFLDRWSHLDGLGSVIDSEDPKSGFLARWFGVWLIGAARRVTGSVNGSEEPRRELRFSFADNAIYLFSFCVIVSVLFHIQLFITVVKNDIHITNETAIEQLWISHLCMLTTLGSISRTIIIVCSLIVVHVVHWVPNCRAPLLLPSPGILAKFRVYRRDFQSSSDLD